MAAFTGTARLARLALRRDRLQLPIWVVALVGLLWVSVSSVLELYPTGEQRLALAVASANSPVALMTNGLVSGTSPGATVATQALLSLAIAAALMSTLAVVRHTRQNEETGRTELIGSAVVGHLAPLTAALLVVAGADVVVGTLSMGVMVANGLPTSGSLLFGAAIAGTGIAFAAVAAVTAQVSETARGANGLAAASVGVAFLARAVGDVAGDVAGGGTRTVSAWPSWLSPIGWAQQTRPYDLDQWWALTLVVVFSAGLVGLAFALTATRDVGAGLRAPRPGPASASARLSSPFGLAWRLQRGVLVSWLVALVVLGVTYGGAASEMDDFLVDNPEAADLFEQLGGTDDLVDAYFGFTFVFGAIAAAGYMVQALLRMRTEEASDRLEPVLAAHVARPRWMAGHTVIAALGATALLGGMGLASAVTHGLVVGDVAGQVQSLVPSALLRIPSALVVGGATVAIFGLWPRVAIGLSWGVFAVALVVSMFGPVLDLPQIVLDLSPFTHVPTATGRAAPVGALLTLLVVAAALAAVGFARFRRRDLAPS
jgi:ABC-2 type transport system permease protein